jgi:predicted transcriptional regulator
MSSAIRSLLWWILAGTKGGRTRANIIITLKERPMNANQLAGVMKLDYKTIRYYLNLLLENGFLVTVGKKYGTMYFLSPQLESNYEVFLEIWKKISHGK